MPYYNRDPRRDHNFDNHPHEATQQAFLAILGVRLLQGQLGMQQGPSYKAPYQVLRGGYRRSVPCKPRRMYSPRINFPSAVRSPKPGSGLNRGGYQSGYRSCNQGCPTYNPSTKSLTLKQSHIIPSKPMQGFDQLSFSSFGQSWGV